MVVIKDETGKYNHRGMWLLLSRHRPRKVLYIFGPKKPEEQEIKKQEKRIQYFKHFGSGFTIVREHKRRIK